MISAFISRIILLIFGILYPAYCSYKSIRTKDVKGYVKWMMYWVVYALFTFFETIGDIFISWFPCYYEAKVLLLFYLLSPATRGSSIIYRRIIHPMLSEKEVYIDYKIANAKDMIYGVFMQLGTHAIKAASNTIVQSAARYIPSSVSDFALNALSESSEDYQIRKSQSNDFVDRGFQIDDDVSDNTETCARSRGPITRKQVKRTKRSSKLNKKHNLTEQTIDVDI